MLRRAPMPLVVLLVVLAGASCSGGESAGPDAGTTTVADPSDPTSTPASTIDIAVDETVTGSSAGDAGTTVADSPDGTDTATDSTDTEAAFTTPSGNIACRMDAAAGVSCWIAEHDWTLDPDDPDLADPDCPLDRGDAIDVTPDGVRWPCYGDFSWDPTAPELAYGDSLTVGEFRCASAPNGLTCRNGAGQGFDLARAAVRRF